MWRIFRWLDRHEPSFYKFTLMLVGLALIVGAGLLLGQIHPMAGIAFSYGTIFALLRASHVYRFTKKTPLEVPQRELPISEASDVEILRRVRQHANTKAWRRLILSVRDEKGRRGDLARAIIKRWEEAGTPDGKSAAKTEEEN